MRKYSAPPKSLLTVILFLAMSANVAVNADQVQPSGFNLLKNGTFNSAGVATLTDWSQINAGELVTIGTEGSDTYVTVANTDGTAVCGIQQSVPLKTEWAKILLRGDIRVTYRPSAASPLPTSANSPYIGVRMEWIDKSGRPEQATDSQSCPYTTPGWIEINQLVSVPNGATTLLVTPEVNGATATAYFKDLTLVSWVSTLQDSFSGSALDDSIWSITEGRHNVVANEQQWFTADEISVANNMLRIQAEQKQIGTLPYSSGQISTIGKFQQLYGLFEFQLKLPVTNGVWPAAYLLPWNDDWPPEIDVEELSGSDPYNVLNTNHFVDDYGRHRQSNVNYSAQGIDRTQWHTYSVVWEPGEVAWYLDDIYRGTTGLPYDDASDVPMYITLNLAVGAFGGDPSQSTWPQDFYIRQVSVYQRSDLRLPLYPENSQEITLPQNSVQLSAISCFPPNSFVKTWSLVEGPGPVHIKDPHNLTTTAVLTKPGMYTFQIKVAAGTDSSSALLLVYVNKPTGSG